MIMQAYQNNAFLSIITIRYKHGWIRKFLKINSSCSRSSGFSEREWITTGSSVVSQCPFLYPREGIMTSNKSLNSVKFLLPPHLSYCTAYGCYQAVLLTTLLMKTT
jgi:hypothetical protein